MQVEKLRDSRKGATVIFTKFTRLKSKYGSSLFCCFEGDDSKYYGSRIENILQSNPDNSHFFNCGGKKEVLKLFEMVNKNEDYKDVKIAYFIDKDFDESIIEIYCNKIYETPCYSIENFYTTISAFKRILKSEFNINESDSEYKVCLKLFIERQTEFHEKTKFFNAWLSCQRDLSNFGEMTRLNLTDFNLNKIISEINLNEIKADYDKEKIESLFPDALVISNDDLNQKITEFEKFNPQIYFRGKFEVDFLYRFIEALKLEFKKHNGLIKKQDGVQINISKKNFISELSQYADTPNCLIKYLSDFNKVPG